jgi:hypothetical protein
MSGTTHTLDEPHTLSRARSHLYLCDDIIVLLKHLNYMNC